jgi:hypothetical protein
MVYASLSWYDIPAAPAYGVYISQLIRYSSSTCLWCIYLRDVYTICRCSRNVVSTKRCIHHIQVLLECCINCEMHTPYADAAGMLYQLRDVYTICRSSSTCIWCLHLLVDTTFQQHLHMVYTSLSWYNIPAASAYGVCISQLIQHSSSTCIWCMHLLVDTTFLSTERCIHHMEMLLECCINWEMYTPYAGAAGISYQLRDVYTICRCCWNVS